jgi:hypothetical protein
VQGNKLILQTKLIEQLRYSEGTTGGGRCVDIVNDTAHWQCVCRRQDLATQAPNAMNTIKMASHLAPTRPSVVIAGNAAMQGDVKGAALTSEIATTFTHTRKISNHFTVEKEPLSFKVKSVKQAL